MFIGGVALSSLSCLQCHHFISSLDSKNCTFIENIEFISAGKTRGFSDLTRLVFPA